MRKRSALPVAVVVATFGAMHACKTPTQVELDVTTRAACTDLKGVDIIVAGDRETAESRASTSFPTTTATDCSPGGPGSNRIGTLVVTPGSGDTASVVIVAGFLERASTCKPPLYKGCIVARRFFSFVSSVSSRLPIVLDPDCVDVPCDANSTCFGKRCVDSRVDCATDDCGSAVLPPDSGPPVDGSTSDGANDAGDGAVTDGGDGSVTDATDAADASGEAGTLFGSCPQTMSGCPGTLSCTSVPSTDMACCWNAPNPVPTCMEVATCAGYVQCCQAKTDCMFYPGRDHCCASDPAPKTNSQAKCSSDSECNLAGGTFLCKTPSGGAPSADCPATHPICTSTQYGPWTGTYRCGP